MVAEFAVRSAPAWQAEAPACCSCLVFSGTRHNTSPTETISDPYLWRARSHTSERASLLFQAARRRASSARPATVKPLERGARALALAHRHTFRGPLPGLPGQGAAVISARARAPSIELEKRERIRSRARTMKNEAQDQSHHFQAPCNLFSIALVRVLAFAGAIAAAAAAGQTQWQISPPPSLLPARPPARSP